MQHEKFSIHTDSAFRLLAFLSPRGDRKQRYRCVSSSADVQYYLNVLSTDLKESKGLNARRTVQLTNNTFHLRTLKIAEKALQDIRLKEMNVQRKVLENVSECQTINLSTLLCRTAQHVFALRKLII